MNKNNYNTLQDVFGQKYNKKDRLDEREPLLAHRIQSKYLLPIHKQDKYYLYSESEKLVYLDVRELIEEWFMNREISSEREKFIVYFYNPMEEIIQKFGKILTLHDLTIEDILLKENNEKVDIFNGYYFFSYTTMELKLKPIPKNTEVDQLLYKFRKKDSEYFKLLLEQQDEYSEQTLGEDIGDYDHGKIYNIVFKNFILCFHYGENDINNLIKRPNKKDKIDLVHLKLINNLNEYMEKEFRLIEREVYKIDNFYLVGEGRNNLQPYYNGSHLSNKSNLPVRLDQLRQIIVAYDELFINKPGAFKSLYNFISNHNGLHNNITLSSSQKSSYFELFKRKNKYISSRSNTPRSCSPFDEPAFKLDAFNLNEFNTLTMNFLHQTHSLQISNELLNRLLERCSSLQKANSELALVYSSMQQTNELAKLSGWAWSGIPLTFVSTLMGINVIVPGQFFKSLSMFYYYFLFMTILSYLFFKVANSFGIL
ncbi:hypothetical protein K502DRAFT_366604 [Neoconidiobolus thromboides FSU 785]|nr:hypothetical protein K502DRAFT_366604 [Neoconidiobolus thromboides FSU 785]